VESGIPIGVRLSYVEFFDPGIAKQHFMALTLQLEPSGHIGDSCSALIASVDAGIRPAPDLLDFVVRVGSDSIEENSHHCLFGELSVLEPGGAEFDVVPLMKKNQYGKIVNFSSKSGKTGSALMSHYSAAKAAIMGFLIYSTLNGVTLSAILFYYTAASIAQTFFIAAMTFGGVSVYGWVTKQDLSSVGSFCFMALFGLIIASVVNIFFRSTLFDSIVSYAGVAIFIGLTAWDTQKLKQIHYNSPGASEQLAVLGALRLYLDFINMFIFLLRIFGRRR